MEKLPRSFFGVKWPVVYRSVHCEPQQFEPIKCHGGVVTAVWMIGTKIKTQFTFRNIPNFFIKIGPQQFISKISKPSISDLTCFTAIYFLKFLFGCSVEYAKGKEQAFPTKSFQIVPRWHGNVKFNLFARRLVGIYTYIQNNEW